MLRLALPACLALLLGLPAARGQDPRPWRDVFVNVIADAEPAIVCILVSRSGDYGKLEGRSAGAPGQLGDFDPARYLGRGFASGERLDWIERLDLAGARTIPESYGSGVVVDDAGLVLTNYHVIRDATKLYVRLPGLGGSYADIHAADPRSDLAVLRLLRPPPGLRRISLGDGGAVRKGQLVVALANPFAAGFRDGSPSASQGIISNVRRRLPGAPGELERRDTTLHHYGTLLQTDARIDLGSSGGALLDLDGKLIGITTAQAAVSGSETSGGFAIPMTEGMRRIVNVLLQGEEVEYGYLGVSLDGRGTEGRGFLIGDVTPNSPAERAQLAPGDTIMAVNGAAIGDYEDLFLSIGTLLAGTEARLDVQSRAGGTRAVSTRLAKFHVPGPIIASKRHAPFRGLRVDHLSVLQQIRMKEEERTRVPGPASGVMIREVEPNSPARNSNLKVAEVITHVNGRPVNSPAEFYRETDRADGPVKVTVLSGDRQQVVELH